jgi:hypothetical protein
VSPRPVDPDALAALTEKTARMASLKEHPGWADLRAHFANRRRVWTERLQKDLMEGRALDQRDIDRHAGFWKGAEFILEHPDMTEKKLETTLKRAQQTEGDA